MNTHTHTHTHTHTELFYNIYEQQRHTYQAPLIAKDLVVTFLPSCNQPTRDTDTPIRADDDNDCIPTRSRVANNDRILQDWLRCGGGDDVWNEYCCCGWWCSLPDVTFPSCAAVGSKETPAAAMLDSPVDDLLLSDIHGTTAWSRWSNRVDDVDVMVISFWLLLDSFSESFFVLWEKKRRFSFGGTVGHYVSLTESSEVLAIFCSSSLPYHYLH